MAKYKVEFRAYIFATDTVDVEHEDDAIEAAFSNGFPEICASCSGWGKGWTVEFPDDPASWEAVDTRKAEG